MLKCLTTSFTFTGPDDHTVLVCLFHLFVAALLSQVLVEEKFGGFKVSIEGTMSLFILVVGVIDLKLT